MLRFPFQLACAAFLLAAPAAPAEESAPPEEIFFGPVGALQWNPLRQALVDVAPLGRVDVPWLRVQRGAANVWNHRTWFMDLDRHVSFQFMDLQVESLTLEAGVPLGPFLSAGVRLGEARLWGGGPIDRSIEEFHRTFNFYNFARESWLANQTQLTVEGWRGPTLNWSGPRSIFLSPVVTLVARALENTTTRLQGRLDVQLPLGSVARALQLQAAELAGGVSLWQRFRRLFAFYMAGTVLWHGNEELGGLKVQRLHLMLEGSLELRVTPHLSWIWEDKLQSPLYEAQYLVRPSAPVRAGGWNASFTPVNLITGGPRLHLEDTALTVYVGEDFMFCKACSRNRFSRENNAPDISIAFVIQRVMPKP